MDLKLVDGAANLFGGLQPHVEHLGLVEWQRRIGRCKEPFDCTWETGGDFEVSAGAKPLQGWVFACGHLAQISNGFKCHARPAKLAQYGFLHLFGDNLGVGAVAVKNVRRRWHFDKLYTGAKRLTTYGLRLVLAHGTQ